MPLRLPQFTRGLRFRLTAFYALFFTLVLILVAGVFRSRLESSLDAQSRDVLTQEWAAMKGYLQIQQDRQPRWFFDRDDPDEAFIVEQIRRVYMLADEQGKPIQWSTTYNDALGLDSPEAIRSVMQTPHQPVWRTRYSNSGVPYLIRAGVVYDEAHVHPYYIALGRSLGANRDILRQYTWIYAGLIPMGILLGSALGWLLAGRALTPVKEVARAAQRISGSNLSMRIPTRGAGDELDYLIATFNRMIERLETSFQQIRQFSTDVSHELRTPITAIRGQLEVALFTARGVEQYREAVMNALQDIERLSHIVRALLLLSQAESGQLALQKSRLDLSETAAGIVEQFQIPADEANVRLVADLAPGALLDADRVQIERLFTNLLSNAIKFTPAGGEVRVSVAPGDGWVEALVADTGRGIAPEHLPHIFDRFYRAPGQNMTAEKGLGLGLSFVAWIVKAHGGRVNVESEPGKGTAFRVTLPAAGHEAPAITR
ncbi:MAG: heavy metal sensor histidine kinase [Bryobacteraceae bacterium]